MNCECENWLERQTAGLNGRCEKHAAMMKAIREAYDAAPINRAERIYLLSDGFGEGIDPYSVEWDWSGIRDSSPAAVERMFAEVKTLGLR